MISFFHHPEKVFSSLPKLCLWLQAPLLSAIAAHGGGRGDNMMGCRMFQLATASDSISLSASVN
jgi:hypothetical protein